MVRCFLGLEQSFEFTVCGPANQEIVSMDAFERIDDRGCQLVVTVAIAKVCDFVSGVCRERNVLPM